MNNNGLSGDLKVNLESMFVPGVIVVMSVFLAVMAATAFYSRGPR